MAAAAPFVSFLLSLLFSQVYELNLMDGLALAGPLAAPDSSTALTNLNFHHVNLSKSFVVSSYGPLFQLGLGTDCIVATGVADIHAGETIIPNAPLDMSVCGALHVGTTPPAAALSIRASTTPTAQDPSITCTLQATMDTMGSATPINLCPMVLSLLTDTSTLPAPVAPPPLYPEASPISASRLLRAAMHIIPQLERAFPLRISLLPLSMTAIRLQVSTLELVSMQQSGQGSAITNLLQMMLKAVAVNGPIHSTEQHEVAIPQGTTMHVDLLLTNLTCNSAGYICSFPVQGGLQLANFVLEGEQQPLAVPFAKLGPSLASMLLSGMLLPKICTMKGDRCSVEMVYDTTVSAPPTWLMVFFPLLAAVLIPLPVLYNLRRHKRQPVLSTKGKPVSMWRLGVEDALLGTLILATCGCFLFADTTSVARIIIGEDMTSYVFNLKGTVRHLWQAGMVPLSIVMIVFCGVYPFMKMACVVYFSMLRYQQYSRILRAVDVFGKFSFIVTMVLIVCAAGLSVPGAVSLEVLPSFYVFLVATICLVIVGNYGIYAYRFGTNVRPAAMSYATCVGTSEKESTHPDDLVGQDSLEVEAAEEDVKRLDGTEPVSEANALPATLNALLQGVWWKVALPSSTIIFALTIPAFVVTSISFEVSGAAQLLTGPTRHYSLFQLATFTNSICAAVAICTVIIAPTVMAMFYEVTIFIGSWTAADVILFACVAGLLQLNDYVELAIGEGLSPIFHVKAHLHWPLILLLLAAILTWALQACHYFDVRDFIARRRRLRGERNNREPVP